MTEYSLKCATRRHKQKISNNKILDKEESKEDNSEHQTSLLILISSTNTNYGIPKGSTFKNKKKKPRKNGWIKAPSDSFVLGGKEECSVTYNSNLLSPIQLCNDQVWLSWYIIIHICWYNHRNIQIWNNCIETRALSFCLSNWSYCLEIYLNEARLFSADDPEWCYWLCKLPHHWINSHNRD